MNPIVGQIAQFNCTTSLGGTLTDPDSITLTLTKPSGEVLAATWPTDSALERDAAGTFRRDMTLDQPGKWSFTWKAKGGVTLKPTDGAIDVVIKND